MADLTAAYGVDAWRADSAQQAGMLANLPRIKAVQQIERRDFEGLDHDGIYELYLTAFEDERIATTAQTNWLQAYVKDQCHAATR